jgi:hypothetical protein
VRQRSGLATLATEIRQGNDRTAGICMEMTRGRGEWDKNTLASLSAAQWKAGQYAGARKGAQNRKEKFMTDLCGNLLTDRR